MPQPPDKADVVMQPPIAWAIAIAAGLALDWFAPARFVPAVIPHHWLGAAVFALGVALAIWAVLTMHKAGTRVEVHTPTTAIVATGPYRFSRNPIYLGIYLAQTGLAIGFDKLWLLATLVPLTLLIRYGVIAQEEAYLERKFGDVYIAYKSRIRRFL